ncbi:uncharacterized protein [Drosophila tropicalis]|uniref:uncharacterized protein n=1 Tax=Drosophila tropicalis TaxID=46794 RepID=UPI0035ABB7F1
MSQNNNGAVSGLLNAILCGASGYGCFMIKPGEHPYAFTGCVVGLCHGLLGLVNCFSDDSNVNNAKEKSTCFMEIVPLPLINVDLYFGSASNNLALGHGLFIVPMAVSALLGLFKDEEGQGEAVETLKTLTILGNITALLYLAINDGSWKLGGMAFLAFMAKFGAQFGEEQSEGAGEPITYLSWTGFYILAAMAVSGEK